MYQQPDVTTGRKIENGIAKSPIVTCQRCLVNVASQAAEAADTPGESEVASEASGDKFGCRCA